MARLGTEDAGWAEALGITCRLCRRFEGLRLESYYCPAGVLTVGYGATGFGVRLGMIVTQEWAETRLLRDATKVLRGTLSLCPRLRGPALAAITDFSFNLGLGRLRASTLRQKLNANDIAGSKRELAKWVRGDGRVLPGLVLRRAAEASFL